MCCLVNEHGRCQASQAAVVEVSSTPVVLVATGCVRRPALLRFWGREVVQEPGFGGHTGLDEVLQEPLLVALDVGLSVLVTSASYQHSNINDERCELAEGLLEAGQKLLRWPDIGCCVL